jgi:hypothetical protein
MDLRTGRPRQTSLPMELAVRYGNISGSPWRIVYTLLRGPIPDGLTLDHVCLNKTCVNPWHLEPVEAIVNLRRHWDGPRAKFGHVRQLPSGRWQAFFTRHGRKRLAPHTFATKPEARAWLEIQRGQTV